VTALEAGSEGDPPSEIDESRAPLLSHLEELRSRLIRSIAIFILVFIGAFFISDRLYQIMTMPLHDALGANARLITTEVTGQFWVKVEVASYSALIVGSPFIANQLWLFVAPGLYRSERKLLKPYLFATPVLFSAGVAMGYFLMPYALRALLIGPFALVDKKSVIPVSVTPDAAMATMAHPPIPSAIALHVLIIRPSNHASTKVPHLTPPSGRLPMSVLAASRPGRRLTAGLPPD